MYESLAAKEDVSTFGPTLRALALKSASANPMPWQLVTAQTIHRQLWTAHRRCRASTPCSSVDRNGPSAMAIWGRAHSRGSEQDFGRRRDAGFSSPGSFGSVVGTLTDSRTQASGDEHYPISIELRGASCTADGGMPDVDPVGPTHGDELSASFM